MLSSKKLTCKGTSQEVFIRVHKWEIQSVMLVFSTKLGELLPLTPSLWFNSPPLPCVNKYTVYNVQCVKVGGYGVLGPRQINTCRTVPSQVYFCKERHLALTSLSLIFLRYVKCKCASVLVLTYFRTLVSWNSNNSSKVLKRNDNFPLFNFCIKGRVPTKEGGDFYTSL